MGKELSGEMVVGIRFLNGMDMTGMDLLTEHGSVRAWPGDGVKSRKVYTTTKAHIDQAAEQLRERGLDFEVNYDMPHLPSMPGSVRWSPARILGEIEGWTDYQSDQQNTTLDPK